MDLIDAEFWKFQDRVFSIFVLSLLICWGFLKGQRNCFYSHFGGTRELFFASFQPFMINFGYRNAIPEEVGAGVEKTFNQNVPWIPENSAF